MEHAPPGEEGPRTLALVCMLTLRWKQSHTLPSYKHGRRLVEKKELDLSASPTCMLSCEFPTGANAYCGA
jgi:hypothetical protein